MQSNSSSDVDPPRPPFCPIQDAQPMSRRKPESIVAPSKNMPFHTPQKPAPFVGHGLSGPHPPLSARIRSRLMKVLPSCAGPGVVVDTPNVPHFELREDPSFWLDHNVQVVVRVRPLNSNEKSLFGYNRCLKQESDQTISWIGQPETSFTFDYVACETINQEMLFKVTGLPMVENCMLGYNSCIFAYGQTGTGKTYTMIGEINGLDVQPSPDRGMIPRIFEFLFLRIRAEEENRRNEKLNYICKCSFIEIYNEQIIDLLDPSSTNLPLREDVHKGVYVENVTEFKAESVRDILSLIVQGSANRRVAATKMNKESSRSHSVFTCVIESHWEKDNTTNFRFARLNLVDLAGSERQKTSGAEGEWLKETTSINKSLFALGHVIMVLSDLANGKQKHVPYRDSKLTYLLQDSLGGNSKTMIIANISPSMCSASNTLSTLKFAQSARLIQNNAIINDDASRDVLALQQQIRLLKEFQLRDKKRLEKSNAMHEELRSLVREIEGNKQHELDAALWEKELISQQMGNLTRERDGLLGVVEKVAMEATLTMVALQLGLLENIMLQDELRESRRNHEALSYENKNLRDSKCTLSCNLTRLSRQLEMANALAEEKEAIATEARQIAEERKAYAKEKEEEVKLLEKSIQKLEATVCALDSKVDLVREEAGKQEVQRELLEAELHQVRKQLRETCGDDVKNHILQLKKDVELLQKEVFHKEDEIAQCKGHMSELSMDAEAQTRECKQKEENNILRKENENLRAKLVKTEIILERVKDELARYRGSKSRDPYFDIEEEQQLRNNLQCKLQSEKERLAEVSLESSPLRTKLKQMRSSPSTTCGSSKKRVFTNPSMNKRAFRNVKEEVKQDQSKKPGSQTGDPISASPNKMNELIKSPYIVPRFNVPQKYIVPRFISLTSDQERIALEMSCNAQPGNPTFFRPLAQYTVSARKPCQIKFPASFAPSLKGTNTQRLILRCHGKDKEWYARYFSSHPGGISGAGLRDFILENKLKEGDLCLFELMENEPQLTMTIHIFPV